jgi:hypothetical protein
MKFIPSCQQRVAMGVVVYPVINENNINELSAWLRDNSVMTVPTKGEK